MWISPNIFFKLERKEKRKPYPLSLLLSSCLAHCCHLQTNPSLVWRGGRLCCMLTASLPCRPCLILRIQPHMADQSIVTYWLPNLPSVVLSVLSLHPWESNPSEATQSLSSENLKVGQRHTGVECGWSWVGWEQLLGQSQSQLCTMRFLRGDMVPVLPDVSLFHSELSSVSSSPHHSNKTPLLSQSCVWLLTKSSNLHRN